MITALEELMGLSFKIPYYQRGYRWEEQEINELLDDLWEFYKDGKCGSFYCLQPIVLKEISENEYYVIDGQQRLTTIYLILSYLDEIRKNDNYDKPLFSLDYETRDKCIDFLGNKKFKNTQIDYSNIDFYHMCNAYKIIQEWFESHQGAKGKIVQILLDPTSTKKYNTTRNVRVIKYMVEDNANEIEVFMRLNDGKIPLTDAELTKALLLQSDKYEEDEKTFNKQILHNIATQWDEIENTLQRDNLWHFINNGEYSKPTRIEFIFDLIADKLQLEKKYFEKKPSKHSTFLILSKYLEDLISNDDDESRIEAIKSVWKLVIDYYERFVEWYDNREYFHYIGYLLSQNQITIDSTIELSQTLCKKEFVKTLKSKIKNSLALPSDKDSIDQLCYEDIDGNKKDQPFIHKLLLLHNIHTTLKYGNDSGRFPFDIYKNEDRWTLEHIYAQSSESITDPDKQRVWLNDHIKSLIKNNGDQTLICEMEQMLKINKIDPESFNNIVSSVYSHIDEVTGFNISTKHSLSNLCLLDGKTNSSLNNSVFEVKREKIKHRETKVEKCYIPICTKNVFMKAYTEYPQDNIYWREEDRACYLKDIQTTLDYYND